MVHKIDFLNFFFRAARRTRRAKHRGLRQQVRHSPLGQAQRHRRPPNQPLHHSEERQIRRMVRRSHHGRSGKCDVIKIPPRDNILISNSGRLPFTYMPITPWAVRLWSKKYLYFKHRGRN